MADLPPKLDYGAPGSSERNDSRWAALVLCAPGAASFILFFANGAIMDNLPPSIVQALHSAFVPLWCTAVATAIASVCLYAGRPFKPLRWYVILNLIINISGLLFSVVAIGAAL